MINKIVAVIFLLTGSSICWSQNVEMNGGEYHHENTACLLEPDRIEIKRQLEANIFKLQQDGIISEIGNKSIVSFAWPLAKAEDFTFNSYYGISNYVDHNPEATGDQYGPSNLDYNCGNRSYDTENGYNHAGIDIFLWPFEWYLVDNDFVEVVAAAPGVIIDKRNGNVDDNCSCEGDWNAVYIRHDDGSVAWYGHLKNNSLTDKQFGETVDVGEYLGVVASSGCSSGPHLHFEVYDVNNNLVDPFAGACNGLNTATWWQDQRPYRKSTLNVVLTHEAVPVFGCPSIFEEPNLKNEFDALETVITAFFYADQQEGQTTQHRIIMPSGEVWQDWSFTSPGTYNASYWFRTWVLPSNAEIGEWTVEATYEGETITHIFYVGVSATHELGNADISIFPNPTSDMIFVKSEITQKLSITLYDAQGKLLIQQQEDTVDFSRTPKGIYFLKVTNAAGESAVEKIIKL